jgi:sigma-B regulation protein RsbU (phosphoserine phosphatase)
VTLGCGVLDSSTGRVRYASAGHEPPLERELEGGVRALAAENGAAIGIDAVADYRLGEAFVAPGDTLVLYTDGVTEAEAADASPFGVERLAALLRDAPDGAPAALVQRIVDTVTAHAGGFHATDDITVMAVRFAPPDVEYGVAAGAARWLVRVDVSAAGIARALQRLRGILAARAVAEERIHAVELVAEELLTNIVRAAEGAGDREIVVECALAHAEIVLTVRDDGPAFDPLELEPVDLGAPISERRVGGLGVHIVKELAARCSYARADGCNVLEIRLSREHAA